VTKRKRTVTTFFVFGPVSKIRLSDCVPSPLVLRLRSTFVPSLLGHDRGRRDDEAAAARAGPTRAPLGARRDRRRERTGHVRDQRRRREAVAVGVEVPAVGAEAEVVVVDRARRADRIRGRRRNRRSPERPTVPKSPPGARP
jgi:hypothetical protein